MVFGQHYSGLSWGWAGVDVFFVLSGFLITGILCDTRDTPHRIWNFYVRRTLRIFPLYYAVFFVLLLTAPVFHWRWDAWWLLWPAYLGNFIRFAHPAIPGSAYESLSNAWLVSGNVRGLTLYLGHLWSLCVEEQFYLIWPWIVFAVRSRRRLLTLCISLVIIMPILRIVGSHTLPPFLLGQGVLYSATPFRIDALLVGALLALFLRGGHAKLLRPVARATFALCMIAIVIWLALNPYARTLTLSDYPAWHYTWGLTFIDIFAASLLVMALYPGSWTYSIFNLRYLRAMGRISYGAYVFHDVPKAVYFNLLKHHPGYHHLPRVIFALICTLLLAWSSYRFFEMPFIRLKERWSR